MGRTNSQAAVPLLKLNKGEINQHVWVYVEDALPGYVRVHMEDGRPGIISRQELSLEGDIDPREFVFPGQRLRAQILGKSSSGKSIALSHRRTLDIPWPTFVKYHQAGDVVSGRVKDIQPHGVYVEILPGIDGLIPLQELAPWPVEHPGDVLHTGDAVEAIIVALRQKSHQAILSLRKYISHLQRSQKLATELGILGETSMPPTPHGARHFGSGKNCNHVLLVEDRLELANGLETWLKCQGWRVWTVTSAKEMRSFLATMREKDIVLCAALLDIDLDVGNGLDWIPDLRSRWPGIHVAVMSSQDRLAEHQGAVDELRAERTFTKPRLRHEVTTWLSDLDLPTDSALNSLNKPRKKQKPEIPSHKGNENATVEVESALLPDVFAEEDNLQRALEQICRSTRAQAGILARLESGQDLVTLVANWGPVPLEREGMTLLAHSPVKDVIVEGRTLVEKRAATGNRQAYFANLLRWMPFDSCLGLQVHGAYHSPHALFLFHRDPDYFTRRHLRRAVVTATAMAASLDRIYFIHQLKELGGYVLAGRLAASLEHELSNRVGSLDVQLANLIGQVEKDANLDRLGLQKGLADLKMEVDRLTDLLEGFHGMIRKRQMEEHPLASLVRRLESVVRALAAKHEVDFRCELDPSADHLSVPGAAMVVQQILFNLCLNAIQHLATLPKEKVSCVQRKLRLWVQRIDEYESPRLLFRVEDNGPGIHAEYAPRIFEPGFTTRPDGSGLGLFIARSLVDTLGGQIALQESKPLVRTVFVVEIPIVAEEGRSSDSVPV